MNIIIWQRRKTFSKTHDFNKNILSLLIFIVSFFIFIFYTASGYCLIKLSASFETMPLDGNCVVLIDVINNEPNGFGPWDLRIYYDANIIIFNNCFYDLNSLVKDNSYFTFNKTKPGEIIIVGGIAYDPVTGKDLLTKGTGNFFKMNFSSKRVYPLKCNYSNIKINPLDSGDNSLRHAQCNQGYIEILPNLTISDITINENPLNDEIAISLYGSGFVNGAIPIIGHLNLQEIIVGPSYINARIPKSQVPLGLLWDVIVTNPNGDFGVVKEGFMRGLHFETGMNIFAYPTIPPSNRGSSFSLLNYLNNPTEKIFSVVSFILDQTSWDRAYWHFNIPYGTDFQILTNEAYILYVKGQKFIQGFPTENAYNFDNENQVSQHSERIQNGLNLITFHPSINSGITSHELIRSIEQQTGGMISINRLQSSKGLWETNLSFFGHHIGNDFPLSNGEGYCLYYKQ